jgi:hypothetical protein
MSIQQMTSEEYFRTYKQDPFQTIESQKSDATRGFATSMTAGILNNVGGFAKGIVKSSAQTLQNIGKGVLSPLSKATGIPTGGFEPEVFEPQSKAESRGKFTGDILQHILAAKATAGLGTIGYIGGQAFAGGARTGTKEGAIKSGVAAAIVPPLIKGFGRLVSGALTKWTAGLTNLSGGKGAKALDAIFTNPKGAEPAFQELKSSGATKLLEKNAQTIMQGVSTIKKEASQEFGKALDKLGAINIPQAKLQATLQSTLNNLGVTMQNGKITAVNSEIVNPALQSKLVKLLTSLNKMTVASGSDVRKLLNLLEKGKFSISANIDADRLAYNSILNQVKQATLSAVNDVTGGKITAMNQAYSQQIQLTDAMESIFGKVQFKNVEEVLNISNKLDTLFTQKPASVEVINKFLTRIGIDPSSFMASEGVRQLGHAPMVGTGGIGGGITGAVKGTVDTVARPLDMAQLAQKAGLTVEVLKPILDKLDEAGKATLIGLLTGAGE